MLTRFRFVILATACHIALALTVFMASPAAETARCERSCSSGYASCECSGEGCGCQCWGGSNPGCSCWCASGCAEGDDCPPIIP